MHHANHFYGHSHVLARYAGVAGTPRIWGYVQHGWNIWDGFAAGMTPDFPAMPRFVWSETVRRRAWSLGRRRVMAIGAPWLYLLQLEPTLGTVPEDQRRGTIWYPFHGWEGQEVLGSHDTLIAQIRDVESGSVTVCLYWNDYDDPAIRSKYQKAGFRVISHGYRGLYHQGTETEFLYRQLAELRSHRRVASNRLSSAIFYGISVGCAAGVYGEPMTLEQENEVYGGQPRIRALWPQMHGEFIEPATAIETCRAELGMDYLIDPIEMSDVFRWNERT